jgi:TDG/mug DNA glycosylase family protein
VRHTFHIPISKDASSEGLAAAEGRTIPDLVAPGLRVLFCGINPGLVSGATGHHFARPGNRFWRVLHAAGFTPGLLDPSDQGSLLDLHLGITNLVPVTSRAAADLTASQLREGAATLEQKVARLQPAFVAVLGMQAYRTAFRRPGAAVGPQTERLARATLWLLPNPSGLQARYGFAEMVTMYEDLRVAAGVARAGAAAGRPQDPPATQRRIDASVSGRAQTRARRGTSR